MTFEGPSTFAIVVCSSVAVVALVATLVIHYLDYRYKHKKALHLKIVQNQIDNTEEITFGSANDRKAPKAADDLATASNYVSARRVKLRTGRKQPLSFLSNMRLSAELVTANQQTLELRKEKKLYSTHMS